MLMIAQLVPYATFGAAALLLGWVAADLALARWRKIKPSVPASEDSGRALAGPPAPLSARLAPRPQSAIYTPVFAQVDVPELEPDPAPVVRLSDRIEAQPDMPINFAHDLEEPEAEAPEAQVEPEPPAEIFSENHTGSSDSDVASGLYNDAIVRRDESVRVYDSSVAASGRHVV